MNIIKKNFCLTSDPVVILNEVKDLKCIVFVGFHRHNADHSVEILRPRFAPLRMTDINHAPSNKKSNSSELDFTAAIHLSLLSIH